MTELSCTYRENTVTQVVTWYSSFRFKGAVKAWSLGIVLVTVVKDKSEVR